MWITATAVVLLLAAILLPRLLAWRVRDVLPVALEDVAQILIGELPHYSDTEDKRLWTCVTDREDVARLHKLIQNTRLVKGSEQEVLDVPAGGSPMSIIYVLWDGATLRFSMVDSALFRYGEAVYAIAPSWNVDQFPHPPGIGLEIDEILEGYAFVPYDELCIAP